MIANKIPNQERSKSNLALNQSFGTLNNTSLIYGLQHQNNNLVKNNQQVSKNMNQATNANSIISHYGSQISIKNASTIPHHISDQQNNSYKKWNEDDFADILG